MNFKKINNILAIIIFLFSTYLILPPSDLYGKDYYEWGLFVMGLCGYGTLIIIYKK